jgi:hypothetical protein
MRKKTLVCMFVCLNMLALTGMAQSAPIPAQAGQEQQGKSFILKFYKEYVGNLLADKDSANEALKRQYMTRALIREVGELAEAAGADPIIRAQDISEGMLNSLKVEHLAAGWYVVSYAFNSGDEPIRIPVRLAGGGSSYRIDCIPPET